MYTQQLPGQQYFQPVMPAPQYYPVQAPYESYQDMDLYNSADRPGDPPPALSNNPATTSIVLFKELTGYPNYGNPSGNADILYTGTTGNWTFDSPAFIFVPGNQRARINIRAVLDDHANVPINRYSARITINGTVVLNGPVQLQHGEPAGGMFTNWTDLILNVPNLRRNNRVTIQNTSTAGPNDWIGFDWMELRLLTR
ncbi:MAG TPA: hypothetical protein VHP38_00615 [Ruminiclostridium sp.]|nr:hypothetical protein [Ruminiclostridium sp.]